MDRCGVIAATKSLGLLSCGSHVHQEVLGATSRGRWASIRCGIALRDRPESLFTHGYWYFGLIDTDVRWLLASYAECADSLPWRLADVTSGRFGHRDPDVLTVVFPW